MAKFPSQNKLTYQTGDISYANYSTIASGGTTGHLNLPKDLSILNRRGYASTTRKGVPLVFRTKLDFFLHDEDGAYGPPSVLDNLMVTLKVSGCQNNWVMRNAAIKWHAAREQMFRDAGIKRKDRGKYSHEIRYNYDSNGDTWLVPIDGSGDAFTGGTWDVSDLSYSADNEFELSLIGVGDAEDTDSFNGNFLTLGHSYLMSRMSVPEDTNESMDSGPAKFSVLNKMLKPANQALEGVIDDIVEEAKDAQDNPPYDMINLAAAQDLYNDVTEPVELGRCLSSTQAAVGSCIVDIPFGIAGLVARAYTSESTSGVASVRGLIHAEVLDIYEMQG